MNLSQLGWTDKLQALTADRLSDGHKPARVVRVDRHRYQLIAEGGNLVGELTGRLLSDTANNADLPTVGDWVLVSEHPDGETATIIERLPRSSSFSRKVPGETTREQVVAANVDTVFLVSGLDHDFNLRRIERYVTLAWNSGATPVIVLNKADLEADIEDKIAAAQGVAPGVEVVAVSTVENPGIDQLLPYLGSGSTVAFLGSSGVGKSSLVNAILGDTLLSTTPVREDDSRGRHTTSFREMFVTPAGTLLIDTPGMRELRLWADESDVNTTFQEIEELAHQCRFSDCAHDTEPGCAVQEALDEGTLDRDRYNSYMKLMREIRYLDRRQSESKQDKHKRDKAQGKMYREVQKVNRKIRGY